MYMHNFWKLLFQQAVKLVAYLIIYLIILRISLTFHRVLCKPHSKAMRFIIHSFLKP